MNEEIDKTRDNRFGVKKTSYLGNNNMNDDNIGA